MANSKYEYVRSFEQPDILLANTWIVIRIDGRGFTKFTARYNFTKPNDRRALHLMNAAAEAVMKELPDLCLAYGNSDEYSFVFHKDCVLFERRASKLTTTIVSTFSAYYTYLWPKYFDDPLTPPLPSFDGRAVCYPSDCNLRDYMSWRQVDCHINNLYNTTFWALVQKGGMDPRAAEQELSGTVSSDKNEILFSRFGINYNNEPEIFRKGSVMYRDFFPTQAEPSPLPKSAKESTPPLSHPQPRRAGTRPVSQPVISSFMDTSIDSPSSSDGTPRGPTFLSSTPSPPPSPPSMPPTRFQYPQTFMPVSPLANGHASTNHKLPILTPIPLPPPTLKPSTRPPPSLSPPDPTAHINTSPPTSPIPSGTLPSRTRSNPVKSPSHDGSSALSPTTQPRPPSPTPGPSRPTLKQRSPSLSILDAQPPIIPLRMSSIPANNKPRKLSIQSQRSLGMLHKEDRDNGGSGLLSKANKHSPPLMTMKELPSPPRGRPAREEQTPARTEPELSPSLAPHEAGFDTARPLTPPRHPLRAFSPAPSSSFTTAPSTAASAASSSTKPPLPSKAINKGKQPKGASKPTLSSESGGWAAGTQSTEDDTGRPKEMSRTQREKERKKRTKARIVIEHVDIIRDEFWEKRPWILSGRTGV